MRKYRTLFIIPVICFSLCLEHTGTAFADENVSENGLHVISASDNTISDNTVSGNIVSGSTVSENTISDNTVSEDTVSDNKISGNEVSGNQPAVEEISRIEISPGIIKKDSGAAVIEACVESTGSYIDLVQAENASAGIKKELFRAYGASGEKYMLFRMRTKSNGNYIFYASDTKGNMARCEVKVRGITKQSFSGYEERAAENASKGRIIHDPEPVIFGKRSSADNKNAKSGKNYLTKSRDERQIKEESDSEKYGNWSLLKEKDKRDDFKAWYEPLTGADDEGGSLGKKDSINDLSDYGIKLFRTDVLKNAGSQDKTGKNRYAEALPDLKFRHPDDNINGMENNNTIMIIGIILFIIILLMIAGALLLLKGGKGTKKKKRTKRRVVRPDRKAENVKTAVTGGTVPAKAPVKAPVKASAAAKVPDPVPLRAPNDDGIEKYARMTEDYVRSKFDIELKRVDLKKYYSDRHGFDCVDFTYQPASGVIPAQFRTHLNDVDTALSNVSGVDTITFAVDNTTGTYRTTFYLGK